MSCDLSEAYCAQLTAPFKGFYTFDQSAHSPMFEEPDRFLEVMEQDVLAGKTGLSDMRILETGYKLR